MSVATRGRHRYEWRPRRAVLPNLWAHANLVGRVTRSWLSAARRLPAVVSTCFGLNAVLAPESVERPATRGSRVRAPAVGPETRRTNPGDAPAALSRSDAIFRRVRLLRPKQVSADGCGTLPGLPARVQRTRPGAPTTPAVALCVWRAPAWEAPSRIWGHVGTSYLWLAPSRRTCCTTCSGDVARRLVARAWGKAVWAKRLSESPGQSWTKRRAPRS